MLAEGKTEAEALDIEERYIAKEQGRAWSMYSRDTGGAECLRPEARRLCEAGCAYKIIVEKTCRTMGPVRHSLQRPAKMGRPAQPIEEPMREQRMALAARAHQLELPPA